MQSIRLILVNTLARSFAPLCRSPTVMFTRNQVNLIPHLHKTLGRILFNKGEATCIGCVFIYRNNCTMLRPYPRYLQLARLPPSPCIRSDSWLFVRTKLRAFYASFSTSTVARCFAPTPVSSSPALYCRPAHFIPNSNGMLTFFMHTESILETRSTAIIDLRRKKNGKDNWN